MGELMASDVRAIETMLKTDDKARRSVSEWIVQLARKIHEKPEDVVWFFEEMRKREEWDEKLGEFERITKDLSPEELFELAVKEAENTPEMRGSTEKLITDARKKIEKFKRIEEKLKRIGVI